MGIPDPTLALLCYLSETGGPLAVVLRPGNAGANRAIDAEGEEARGRSGRRADRHVALFPPS
jgi:hypothetical protein